MKTSRIALLLAGLASTLALAAPQKQWSITALPSLPSERPFAWANAVNNRGDIVGWSNIYEPALNAFRVYAMLWQEGTGYNLGEGGAYSINERGVIGGSTDIGDGLSLYKDGRWVSLGHPGAPFGINRSETVVGWSLGGLPHAYMLKDGVLTDLGTFGGTTSSAQAINDRGQVVGYASLPGDTSNHAFLYENGVMKDLGTLNGGTESRATAINNHGVVVGDAWDSFGNARPFIYDGVMRQLFQTTAWGVVPTGINDHGAVVGTMMGNQSFHYADGVVTALEQLPAVKAQGWTQLIPHDINDRGWIVGLGRMGPLQPPAIQEWKAFVLRPEHGGAPGNK